MKRIALLLLIALTACDPSSRTEYMLRPPKGEKAQDAANECFSDRQVCRSNCGSPKEICEHGCEMSYHTCYRKTGGQVVEREVCLKDCK